MTRRLRLRPEDIIVGLDLAGEQHQAVICRMEGERLTRFRIPQSLNGFDNLLMRTQLIALQSTGRRIFTSRGHRLWRYKLTCVHEKVLTCDRNRRQPDAVACLSPTTNAAPSLWKHYTS